MIKERIILNIIANQKPSTLNPGTIRATKRIKRALITKVKSPNVTILIGSARIERSGFNNAFTTQSTIATTIATGKLATVTPGKRYEVIPTPAATMRTLIMRSIRL